LKTLPLIALVLALGVSACKEDVLSSALPGPAVLTARAIGHYGQMSILDHDGPKGQVYLAGMEAPLWFGQVRDALAYLKSPEQEGEILVLYVNDMGKAESWETPGANNWITAQQAFYVVGSGVLGGMGAPEIVPFGDAAKAKAFAATRGGKVLRLNKISAETVLSPVDFDQATLEADT